MPKHKLLLHLLASGLALLPVLSSAHTYVGIFNVGAKAGFIPFEAPHNTVFTAGVQAQMVRFEPDLALVGFADYWRDEYSHQGVIGTTRMYNEEKERELAFGALLVYELAGLPLIRPYAGVGFELSLTHKEYSWVDSTDLGYEISVYSGSGEYDSNGAIFCAVGGIRWPLIARWSAITEIKYVAYGEEHYAVFAGLTYQIKK